MDSIADIITVNSMFLYYGPEKAIYLTMVYNANEFIAGLAGSVFNFLFVKNESFKMITFMFLICEIFFLALFVIFFDTKK